MENPKQQNKALKLLRKYRPTLWRKSALEVVPNASAKSLSVCIDQIRLTNELVETLKIDSHIGKKMYWILHATFMTDRQPGDIEEMLADIAEKYEYIPRRTYFRLKKQAIERLNDRLEEMTTQNFQRKAVN